VAARSDIEMGYTKEQVVRKNKINITTQETKA
jgi:hypothetical protein